MILTGAGKGIGRATAEILLTKGAHVIALTRSADDVTALRALGCTAVQVDLADAVATKAAAQAALPDDC